MPEPTTAHLRRRLSSTSWYPLVLSAAIIAVAVPWPANFPTSGLDPSWRMALNSAVAEHLDFGRDIAFSYGPYASVATAYYDPDIWWLTLLGGLLLAAGLVAAIVPLARTDRPVVRVVVALVFVLGAVFSTNDQTTVLAPPDGPLMTYPVLVVARLLQLARAERPLTRPELVSLAALAAPLPLISMIKSSAAPLAVLGFLLGAVIVLRLGRAAFATFVGTGVAAVPVLWWLAHQPLTALPAFARTSLWALSGYSEAMSNGAALSRSFGFAAVSLLLLAACWLVEVGRLDRVLLGVMVAATLFVSFKSVAVRTHDMSEASALMVVAAVIVLLAPRPRLAPVAVVLILAVAWHPILRLTELTGARLWHAPGGIAQRLVPNHMDKKYDEALAKVRGNQLMPPASSDSDVYTVQQSDLLAQGKAWSPRPTLQSYAAYTPALAEMNRRHIVGPDAPRHIYYRSGAIDRRLPALEDGPSLLPLLSRYRMERYDAVTRFLVLDHRHSPRPARRGEASTVHGELGRAVDIPATSDAWVARFDIDASLFGWARSALWRPPMMTIQLTLENGTVVSRRFIPTMARSEFLLSPYFPTTAHLATLFGASDPRRIPSAVRSFRLVTDGTPGWESGFTVRLQPVEIPTYHPVETN